MSGLEITRSPAADVAYGLLSQVDLGADAANLFAGGTQPPWAGPLRIAYRTAPGRLSLQVVGLWHDEVDALRAALRDGPPGLQDPEGRRLASAFVDAIDRFGEGLVCAPDEHARRRDAFEAAVGEDLRRLRAALWTDTAEFPALRLVDCAALGTAGRATWAGDVHVVAISLDRDPVAALMQAVHEQVHAVTDPPASAMHGRATERDAEGYAMHARIEDDAIAFGRDLIARVTPRHAEAYARWISDATCTTGPAKP